jgi:hypothetical protein
MFQSAKAITLSLFGIALMLYLIAGAVWFAVPVFTVKCPLTVNSQVSPHTEGPSWFFIEWVTWPWNVRDVEREADRRGIPGSEVRYERYCPTMGR